MGYALSLYQALIGIHVPNDEAAAVVQALEHNLSSEFATKPELAAVQQSLRSDLAILRAEVKGEFEQLRVSIRSDMTTLENRLTVRLGGMMIACCGLLLAILKLA